MNSGNTPSPTHQAESFDNRPRVLVAKGTPFSMRMRLGSPYSLNRRVNTGFASATLVDKSPWQSSRYRPRPTAIDRGLGRPLVAASRPPRDEVARMVDFGRLTMRR